jgi:hypothetical protein
VMSLEIVAQMLNPYEMVIDAKMRSQSL